MEGTPHPKSEAYRKHRSAINEHAESLLTEKEAVTTMFPKVILGYELTPEEREDAELFAQYAAKRLSAGAATKPISHFYMEDGDVREAMSEAATGGHDLWHAAIRYMRTEGKTMVPAYMEVGNEHQQFLSREALIEEVAVDLLDADALGYARKLLMSFKTGETAEEYIDYALEPGPPRDIVQEIKRLWPLQDAAAYARIHLLTVLATLKSGATTDAANGEDADKALTAYQRVRDDILDNPDEACLQLARDKFDESALGERPEPRFEIRKLRTIAAPIIARERLKQMAAKLDKLAA